MEAEGGFIKRFGAVEIGDRNRHQFQFHLHVGSPIA